MIYNQDTMPLPRVRDTRPTFRQFREYYQLSREDIAQQAQMHIAFVNNIEKGFRIEAPLALSIFAVLSERAGRQIRFNELRGVCIKRGMVRYKY